MVSKRRQFPSSSLASTSQLAHHHGVPTQSTSLLRSIMLSYQGYPYAGKLPVLLQAYFQYIDELHDSSRRLNSDLWVPEFHVRRRWGLGLCLVGACGFAYNVAPSRSIVAGYAYKFGGTRMVVMLGPCLQGASLASWWMVLPISSHVGATRRT